MTGDEYLEVLVKLDAIAAQAGLDLYTDLLREKLERKEAANRPTHTGYPPTRRG
jgi:hypothetical protein